MPVYLIAQLNIHDRSTYAKYGSGFMEIFSRYGGRLLSVDEAPKVIEGEWGYTRTVLLEFPSEDRALSWYHSGEYQDLSQHRRAASDANLVLIRAMTPNLAVNADARRRAFGRAAVADYLAR